MDTERRTFARIMTSLQAFMRKVASPQTRPNFRGGPPAKMEAIKEGLQKTSLPEPLLNYFESMNTKLDTILGLLQQTSIQAEYPLTATITQISAAGIQFTSPNTFQINDNLEIVITLTRFPLYFVNAVGTITRQEQGDDDGTSRWVFAFTNIRDNDRESIIQYVFQEQREMIRGEKE